MRVEIVLDNPVNGVYCIFVANEEKEDNSVVVGFRPPPAMLEWIDRLCSEQQRNRANMVIVLLTQLMKGGKKK